MKVLMTTDFIGGVCTYVLELCRHLQNREVDMHVIGLGRKPNPDQQRRFAEISNLSLRYKEYKLEWMDRPWDDVAKSRAWLQALIEEIRPDIIHLNNFVNLDRCPNIPIITVFHSCVLSWWRAVKQEEAPQDRALYRKHVYQSLQNSDVVVSPSRAMQSEIEGIYGRFADMRVIYNGRSDHGNARREKDPIVFTAGRVWDEAKNMAILERVAEKVKWPIYVAGDCGDISAPDHHRFRHLHLLGQLTPDEVRNWMGRASIYVLPALYEPFGLSVLEAAQAECALVLNRLDSLRELWSGAAEFVEGSDVQEISDGINGLIDDPSKRAARIQVAHRKAMGLQAEKMAEQYFKVYLELFSRDRKTDGASTPRQHRSREKSVNVESNEKVLSS